MIWHVYNIHVRGSSSSSRSSSSGSSITSSGNISSKYVLYVLEVTASS